MNGRLERVRAGSVRTSVALGAVGAAVILLISVAAADRAVQRPAREVVPTPLPAAGSPHQDDDMRASKVEPRLARFSTSCEVTLPRPVFVAPPPAPAKPPAYYMSDWYGSPALWTMIERDGEVWSGLPRNSGYYGQKTFWWSVNWPHDEELEPQITVSGRRLDEPGRLLSEGPGTNASADFGAAMLIGVGFPTTGCWEITARYRGAELSYVVLVEE